MESTNAARFALPRTIPWAPLAFGLGVGLLLFASMLQIATYVNRAAEMTAVGIALALTVNAYACFLYVWWRGNWALRIFALLCGLAALFNTFTMLWWTALAIRHLS